MIRLQEALLLAAASIATTGTALAQDAAPDDEAAPDPAPDPAPAPAPAPLVLGKDQISIAGSTLSVNVSADAAGDPISLAPSVWYGVREKLTVGLTHDGGTTPWSPRPAILSVFGVDLMGNPTTFVGGGGICIGGDDGGCDAPYGNVGVDALYALKQGKLGIAAHPALDVADFDPFALQLRIGALGRYTVSRKVSLVFDPRIELGLTARESYPDVIDVPVWGWYAVHARVGAYAHTGIAGPLEGFVDGFRIPLQIGASFVISAKLSAGVDFAFTNLVGRGGGFEGRALGFRVAYALERRRGRG